MFAILLILCSFASANKNLTVHLFPESHNDAGWIHTAEEYFQTKTKKIFTSVIDGLEEFDFTFYSMKFQIADLMFFMRWYDEQSEEKQNITKKLIEQGRLVFINGGWVMSDEAIPSYKQSLLQFRLGLDVMNSTFGKRATIGWQSDSFGHSAVTVTNMHMLGYEFLIGQRITVDFKNKLKNAYGLHFFWEGHQVSKSKSNSNLLSYITQFHYGTPDFFMDSRFGKYRRSNWKVDNFFTILVDSAIKGLNAMTNGNIPEYHVLTSFSGDFGYIEADKVFREMPDFTKSLVECGNSQGYNTKVIFDTYYEYLKVLKSQNLTFGQFKGDFLPFQETYFGRTDFWSGFYSTKLHLKRQIVHLFNEIQTTKLLLAIRVLNKYHTIIDLDEAVSRAINSINEKILEAEKLFSVTLHHDAITGTSKRHVTDDYIRMTHEAMDNLSAARETMLTFNQAIDQGTINEMQQIVSKLDYLEMFHYTVVNPNGYQRDEIMNITLPNSETDANYAFVIQHSFESKIDTNVTAYKVDMYNMDNEDKKPKVETKAFVKISVPALGDTQVYLLKFSGGQQKCTEAGIR